MIKANQDIRSEAKDSGICLWEVAEVMGVHDFNLSRKLRRELPQQEKDRIFTIIERLRAEREGA